MTRLAVLLASGVFLAACGGSPAVTQPIQFSHKAHAGAGLPCALCHQFVERESFAGIPATSVCMTCHRGAITDNPEAEKVRQYGEQGMEIPWQRALQLPIHVYFSHRRHVTLGGLKCAECHGNVENVSRPVLEPAIALDMDGCMACHAQRNANNDCNACHR